MKRKQVDSNVFEFTFDYENTKFNQSILALTDVHFDSPYCDRKMLKRHLEEAKEKNAYIFFNGDLFDVMGCYKDPRSKAQDIRSEYLSNDTSYLDAIIQDCYQFLLPYQDRILFMGYGNHETSILKHRDTDPLKRLVYMLNQGSENEIFTSQYYGFCIFKFNKKKAGIRKSVLGHHHGHGGSARRSKGVLNVDLDSQQYPFLDIYFSGHTHQKWLVPVTRYHLTKTYELKTKVQYHIKGGSYKDESKKAMGWAVEKGFPPTVTGGWWIDFTMRSDRTNYKLHTTITEAK